MSFFQHEIVKNTLSLRKQQIAMNAFSHLLPFGTLLQGGRYKITGHLSSGGFGNTYKAFDFKFKADVAIKEFFMKGINHRGMSINGIFDGFKRWFGNAGDHINSDLMVSVSNPVNEHDFGRQRAKFIEEAVKMYHLHHPSIVRVSDYFDENNTSYYVMDLIDGESLRNCLEILGRPLTEKQVVCVMRQMTDALAIVHHAGILHLDIKPANIMLDKNGKSFLIDFGASKQIDADSSLVTTSSPLCYTPGFAPSEQINGLRKMVGPWTDFYALGATAYNLVTNITPPDTALIIDKKENAFLFPENVSSSMREFIIAMMKPGIKSRPQTTAEVMYILNDKFDTINEDLSVIYLSTTTKEETQSQQEEPLHSDSLSHNDDIIIIQPPQDEKNIQKKVQNVAETPHDNNPQLRNGNLWKWLAIILSFVLSVILIVFLFNKTRENQTGVVPVVYSDSDSVTNFVAVNKDSIERANRFRAITAGMTSGDLLLTNLLNDDYPEVNYLLSNMAFVEADTFTMWCNPIGNYPRRKVTLTQDFFACKYETTQEAWKEIMGYNRSYFDDKILGNRKGYVHKSRRPVERVYYHEVEEFVNKLNQLTEHFPFREFYEFSLPTHAQWYFTARGGKKTHGYWFAGCDRYKDLSNYAWWAKNCGTEPITAEERATLPDSNGVHPNRRDSVKVVNSYSYYGTHPVGGKKPNELGLYDMSGNVFEMCCDGFEPWTADDVVDPVSPKTADSLVVHKGGSWIYYYRHSLQGTASYCAISHVSKANGEKFWNLGFRIFLVRKKE